MLLGQDDRAGKKQSQDSNSRVSRPQNLWAAPAEDLPTPETHLFIENTIYRFP